MSLGSISGIDATGSARRAALLEAEALCVAADVLQRLFAPPVATAHMLRLNNTKVRALVDILGLANLPLFL